MAKTELSTTATLSSASTTPEMASSAQFSCQVDSGQGQVTRNTGYLRSTDCRNLVLRANQVILVRVSHAEPPNTLWVQPFDTRVYEMTLEMW